VNAQASERRGSYVFGRYCLSADGTMLVRDGVAVPLAPKALLTLLTLVERGGEVVRKGELLQTVWPDSFVEETGLARNISVLRKALGPEGARYIVTAPRVGYRFDAPVRLVDAVAARPRSAAALPGDGPSRETLRLATEPPPRATRLIILPFRLLREDPDIGFLAFSLPDAVANALAGMPGLVVRSTAAAARFAADGFDPRAIAAAVDVDAVVTGTLLRAGEQLRLSAQLVAVPEGTVLWAETCVAACSSIFELQDRLVDRIVSSLALTLTARERERLRSDAPANALAYECFLRGNEAVGRQGVANAANLRIARELYARSVESDPRFAPAWARLGRCHYLIGKADDPRGQHFDRAEACFTRALALSPDLPLAHNLYALFEVDRGRARGAMVRLLPRALAGSASAELYAALVQACRFCGLLEPAIVAHRRARELDSAIGTGGYLAYWQWGDEEQSMRENVNLCWLMEAITVAPRDPDRARAILAEERDLTAFARTLVACLRGGVDGQLDVAREQARRIVEAFADSEAIYFVARTVARFGDPESVTMLQCAFERGFVPYRVLLRRDPWLDPVRRTAGFQALLERAREAYRVALAAYLEAGGDRLLGGAPMPEELERVVA
jgi:eukaryotic-like serine/threonine-protein kinase